MFGHKPNVNTRVMVGMPQIRLGVHVTAYLSTKLTSCHISICFNRSSLDYSWCLNTTFELETPKSHEYTHCHSADHTPFMTVTSVLLIGQKNKYCKFWLEFWKNEHTNRKLSSRVDQRSQFHFLTHGSCRGTWISQGLE